MKYLQLVSGAVVITLSCLVQSSRADAQATTRDSAVQAYQAARAVYQQRTRASLDSATTLWHRALLLFRQAGDRVGEAGVLGSIAIVHKDLGSNDSALAYHGAALLLSREIGDRKYEAVQLSNIGVVHINVGQLDSGLAYYRAALAIQQDIADTASISLTLSNIGVVYKQRGELDSALTYYGEALEIRRRTGDRSGVAATLNNIGSVFLAVGQFDSAFAYFHEALPIRREVHDLRGEGRTLNNIAAVYVSLGQRDVALSYLGRALEVHQLAGDRISESIALHTIGVALFGLGRLDSAQVYFLRALDLQRVIGDRLTEGHTLTGIGMIHQELGRLDSARVYLQLAIDNRRATGQRLGEGVALGVIGQLYFRSGQMDSALTTFGLALAVNREVGDRHHEAVALQGLGQIHHRASSPRFNLATAVAYYDSSAAVLAILAGAAGADPNQVSIGEIGVGLFEDWALAYLARISELGPGASAAAALAVAERGRARALLRLMSATSETSAASHFTSAAGRDLVVEGRALIAGATAQGMAVLYYLAMPETLLTWLALPSGEIHFERRPVALDSLGQRIAMLRADMGNQSAPTRVLTGLERSPVRTDNGDVPVGLGMRARVLTRELAALLIPLPIRDRLAGVRELLIVPDGPLALLSFAALTIDQGDEPISARMAIRYAPSLSSAIEADARPLRYSENAGAASRSPDAVLVVGNPRMPAIPGPGGGLVALEPLPGAERESRWVATRLGATSLNGPEATESVIRGRLSAASVIHLATHGFAFSSEARARNSFVVFAPDSTNDGLYTVAELLDDPKAELQAELVVLSACETGLGDVKRAEGTIGLQRAFLARGARAVLVSLWSVDDRATGLLMQRFYTHWLDDSDRPTKAEALRRAQVDVRGTKGFEEPRYWAAFQLVGGR